MTFIGRSLGPFDRLMTSRGRAFRWLDRSQPFPGCPHRAKDERGAAPHSRRRRHPRHPLTLHRLVDVRVPTSHLVPAAERDLGERRHLLVAPAADHARAARVKGAACRRVERRRHVPLEEHAEALAGRIGYRDRGEEGARVRVVRARVERRPRSPCSTVLPRYITATRCATCSTMFGSCGDEEVGDAELLLQVLQQVHDLRLDRARRAR